MECFNLLQYCNLLSIMEFTDNALDEFVRHFPRRMVLLNILAD